MSNGRQGDETDVKKKTEHNGQEAPRPIKKSDSEVVLEMVHSVTSGTHLSDQGNGEKSKPKKTDSLEDEVFSESDNPPEGPREHIVKPGETLNSIAAFYDTTPSHLAFANRMSMSRMVFPGDKIQIPPPSPEPKKPPQQHREVELEEEIIEQQFIKINTKHITDGKGVVYGSLLITPKTVMFNPNKTDTLVIESGSDAYQVITPAELVVNIAIFDDFGKFYSILGIAVKESDRVREHLYSPSPEEESAEEEECKLHENETHFGAENVMYLRLSMGKPLAKRLPRSVAIVSYGEQTLEPEYWFAFRKRSLYQVYKFLIRTFPNKFGLLDHMAIERTGYEVIRPGVKILEEEAGQACNRESVSMIMKKNLTLTDLDLISEMIGTSDILRPGDREALATKLPPRVDGHNWELYFSTTNDGFSLTSLYRKFFNYEGPALILIQDLNGHAFGAFITTTPHISEHFYGTGECFVFTLRPKLQIFNWTGENDYFVRGEKSHFIVGSGNGKLALWIDEDINQGRSVPCPTFDNVCLASSEDFTIKTLEAWAFVL